MVLSVISLLFSISVPAFSKAKYKARSLIGASRQRNIVTGVTLFATDNDGWYPPSVATIGQGSSWNWVDPRQMIAKDATYPGVHRAMSEYLADYIEDARIMYCANAPRKYKYLQDSWDAGDRWDNPENLFPWDPMTGTYCFYWNYVGSLPGGKFFVGARRLSGRPGESKLLLSDYFGYDHYRSRNAYGSCEKFKGASVTRPERLLSADFWRSDPQRDPIFETELMAGYTDGHVESYTPSDTVTMKVIINRTTGAPYPNGVGPGDFFLPLNGIR